MLGSCYRVEVCWLVWCVNSYNFGGMVRINICLRMGKILISVLVFCTATSCFAWGPEGHRLVADIARQRLTPAARRAIIQLLGDDDLAEVSSWADAVRRDRAETFGWHFVDIPWNANGFDESRDCFHPNDHSPSTLTDHRNCVVDRIEMFARVLADTHAPRWDRIEALKFLVHFVGDIHQPLHAIAEARGGNDIHVIEFGRRECGHRQCDLHGTWDAGLIHHAHVSEQEYTTRLNALITREKTESRSGGTPTDWANESFHLAHSVWVSDGSVIDDNYYRHNRAILDQRLAVAGVRLARVLNDALH
jgi:hypothetical protein